MPELAEIETLKNYLEKHIIGEKIAESYRNRNNLRYALDSEIENNIENCTIERLSRRAKFLNIHLSNDYVLTYHLGMSGKLTIEDEYQPKKHDHFIVTFASGRNLVLNDARRFGMIYICKEKDLHIQDFLKNMGPEPLNENFDAAYLFNQLKNKKLPIKLAIMDSKNVVGVGNIYAAESLFLAKIHPGIPARVLTLKQIDELVNAIKLVLNRAIQAGGTTLKDFVSGDGTPGYFKQELNVYGREGENCNICKSTIKKIKQSGRSSFYCHECQE